ncbi:MAG: ABC transporter ATP-binding protein [Paracoccaceae bacterium]
MTAPAASPLVEVRGLTKRFGDTAALDGVDLAIAPAERHALVGENGAGKSTLVKALYGLIAPDEGAILWNGVPVRLASPAEARARGIGMVFQHFSTFDALSVAENVALAAPGLSLSGLAERIETISKAIGLPLDPDRPVHALSAGEKQRVEIVRALLQEPKLLILDEPTSVLTPAEAEVLFDALVALSGQGTAVLYISHRLGEIAALCERATVLRRGRVVETCDPRETPPARLAESMVGERVGAVERREPPPIAEARYAKLRVNGLGLSERETGGRALADIHLRVEGGEIVGIAGLAGEGQAELMAALIGETRLPLLKGAIEIEGRRMAHRGPSARRRQGAAFVPEDRGGHGAVPSMGLADNVMLTHHSLGRMAPRGWLRRGLARGWVERIRSAFDVRHGAGEPAAAALSGGNLQKFLVGREILRGPTLLVIDQPTWGVDAQAAQRIRQALVDLAAEGAGVLVISQDHDELFAIADRIAVMYRGRLSPARPVDQLDARGVGLMMAGEHPAFVVPRQRRSRRGKRSGRRQGAAA